MSKIDAFFKLMDEHKASHIYLAADQQPDLIIMVIVKFVKYKKYEEEKLREMLYEIMPEKKVKSLKEAGETCFTYELPGLGRYRNHLYMQRQGLACVFKTIPNKAKTIEELGLPPLISQSASLPDGLIIVTGPKESGKTITLAAIVNKINRTRKPKSTA